MPLQPRVEGDDVQDQWSEEVTYELNNVIAQAALTAAQMNAMVGNEIIPVYATSETGNDQSTTLGSRQFVYYAETPIGTPPTLPLPDGTVFVQFRGADTNTVEISVRTLPTSMVNRLGETRDWTVFTQLIRDWSIGAIDIEEFPEDPDGGDFGYRTDMKILYARVIVPSGSTTPGSSYADPTLSRSFDYTWTRNGSLFVPQTTGVTVDFPFLFVTSQDLTADAEGTSSQFLCNIVQL